MSARFTISKDDVTKTGRWLMAGALAELTRTFFIVVAAVLLIGAVFDALGLGPQDSTDGAPGQHSGMRPLTDALTGCQYLATSSGGMTPRLSRDGRQMCGGAR